MESPSCADPNVVSLGPACVFYHMAWECPPFRGGRVTDTGEKESPLTTSRPGGRGSAYRHPGTTKIGEQASDDLPELDLVSQGTFQWSRTSPGEPSGHVHGKQRSQRSPSTSKHSGNTEKIPPKVQSGPETPSRAHRTPSDAPFLPTTSASRAITFKGFLTTLTLRREEVVTVCPGLGTFETVHGHLDLPLRSPTSPISHCAVTGASVPTPFSPNCHSRCLTGTYCPWLLAGSPDPLAASPTLSLVHRG
ncbi:hypothetical protein CRG98_015678 [Punica granatum]|uniref:Uncharacterized protein n=1 Tax=Punica granatum TaxID=22663 RepID=A0A2I0K5S0_PUNGR|nr:hypothetical protein CRG98_015678 [Punica granatum]